MEESAPAESQPLLYLHDEGDFFTIIEQIYIEEGYELLESS